MTEPKKYRKKPVIIVAIQYLPGKNEERLKEFVGEENIISWEGESLIIRTLEGDMKVSPNNFVIRGVEGEVYPIQWEIFNQTYEEVEGEANG